MSQANKSAQHEENQQKLKGLDRLAWVLDSSIPIPGTSRTIGLDGIIGLIRCWRCLCRHALGLYHHKSLNHGLANLCDWSDGGEYDDRRDYWSDPILW